MLASAPYKTLADTAGRLLDPRQPLVTCGSELVARQADGLVPEPTRARLEPGRVKETDEDKGEHDEEEDHPGQENHDAEQPSDVGVERYVAEA